LLVKSTCDDWFQFSLDDLAPAIAEQNSIIHALCSARHLPPSIVTTLRGSLQRLLKHFKDKVIIAKAKWASHLCSKIHDMAIYPRLAWERIRLGCAFPFSVPFFQTPQKRNSCGIFLPFPLFEFPPKREFPFLGIPFLFPLFGMFLRAKRRMLLIDVGLHPQGFLCNSSILDIARATNIIFYYVTNSRRHYSAAFPSLFVDRAAAPSNHGPAAPHRHVQAVSRRTCVRCRRFARLEYRYERCQKIERRGGMPGP
jgi:hypothetical protein